MHISLRVIAQAAVWPMMKNKSFSNLRILLIGAVSFPGGLVGSYRRAFEKLGVNVLCFEPKMSFPRLLQRDAWKEGDRLIDKARRRFKSYLLRFSANQLLRKITLSKERVDLVFVFKCSYMSARTLSLVKEQTKALLFHFNADSPFDKQPANSHPNLVRSIPLYDCYFIWHRGLLPKLYDAGAKKIEYLPFAWDPDLHPPAKLTKEDYEHFGSDISFVGNWTPERERWLSYLTDCNLAIWGAYLWERTSNEPLKKRWTCRVVVGEAFAKVCQASKINLNFLRDQNKGSHNMRTFEVVGCGGFLLTERSEEQLEFFEEDKEIACFSTPGELREKIEFYLPRGKLRRKIAKAAHAKVKEKHTYLQRAKHILKVYGEISCRKVSEYLG